MNETDNNLWTWRNLFKSETRKDATIVKTITFKEGNEDYYGISRDTHYIEK